MTSHTGVTEIDSSNLRDTVLLEIDSSIFPKDAVLKAAYWMGDRCRVRLLTAPDGRIVAEISKKGDDEILDLSSTCGDFENALIDFALRERIALETRGIQEILVRQAFSEAMSTAPLNTDG
jgi:His-Xaa-Ser system protein HxsD